MVLGQFLVVKPIPPKRYRGLVRQALLCPKWLPAVEKAWAARNVFFLVPQDGLFFIRDTCVLYGFYQQKLGLNL